MSKKDDLPAMPFYWGDWFKSPDVQSLPRDVKCLWFEMLGRMWESNERGYLTINGKPMSDIAKANALGFGSNVTEYRKYEKILEDTGLFSRRKSDGAIYSRKILHLCDLRQKRKKAGSKGGSKTQANAKANTENEIEDEIENEENKEEGCREEIADELVEELWAQTFGRKPNNPEKDETMKLIKRVGWNLNKPLKQQVVYRIMYEGTLQGFKKIRTLVNALDENGDIMPKGTNQFYTWDEMGAMIFRSKGGLTQDHFRFIAKDKWKLKNANLHRMMFG